MAHSAQGSACHQSGTTCPGRGTGNLGHSGALGRGKLFCNLGCKRKRKKKKKNTTKNPGWSCMLAVGKCCVLSYCCPIAHTTAAALWCRMGSQYMGQLWRNVSRTHFGGCEMYPGLDKGLQDGAKAWGGSRLPHRTILTGRSHRCRGHARVW